MLNSSSRFFLWLFFAALIPFGQTEANSPLWLSDSSPHAGHGKGMRHAHGGPVEIRRGVSYKHMWLRLGDPPLYDGYVVGTSNPPSVLVLDAQGKVSEHALTPDDQHGMYHLEVPMPDEGFYNAYVRHEWAVNGLREVMIAKAEFLKHSCREGHDDVKPKMPPRSAEGVPLEIIRERLSGEDFHTTQGFGDTITFVLRYKGQPVRGAEVTMITQLGWRNTVISDAEGRARFMLIRDYYPPWHEFQKRHAQNYLVKASHTVDEDGELNGAPYTQTRYVTSFTGSYYPSSRDYTSYAYGLSFGLFAFTLTGAGVYFYRRRRRQPYREVRFDEKA